jgi:hypothetical protein
MCVATPSPANALICRGQELTVLGTDLIRVSVRRIVGGRSWRICLLVPLSARLYGPDHDDGSRCGHVGLSVGPAMVGASPDREDCR